MSELLDVLIANNDSICRALADSTADFICLATSHGEPFYFNLAARRMIGLGEEEPVPSGSLHDYYSEDSWKELRDVAVPAVNRSGHWEGRSQFATARRGELLAVQTIMFRVKTPQSDKPTCLAILHRDAGPGDRLRESWRNRRPANTPSSNRRWTRSSPSITRGSSPSSIGRPSRRSATPATRCWGRGRRTCSSPLRPAPASATASTVTWRRARDRCWASGWK